MNLTAVIKYQLSQANALDKPILVAVSTGVDSMVLLANLQQLIPPEKIHVAYVDHQLRLQSQAETQFIKQYCQKHCLKLHITTWPKALHPSSGIEQQARNFRYEFFKQIMLQEKLTYLLTAHHGDDQLETWLMKLLRGGQLEQLVSIVPKREFAQKYQLLRPLLTVDKQEIIAYAKQHELQWFEDETNVQETYLRNRLRKNVIPQLKKENLAVIEHVNLYSQQLADLLLLQKQVYQQLKQKLALESGYCLEKWQKLPSNQQALFIKNLCQDYTLSLSISKLQSIIHVLNNKNKPQATVQLTKEHIFYKAYACFGIKLARVTKITVSNDQPIFLELDHWVKLSENQAIGLFTSEKHVSGDKLFLSALPEKLFIRHRLPGDKLLTSIGKQKVKKILIDHKIPQKLRERLWLVADQENNVYWIVGIKKSNLAHDQKNAKMQYMIVYRDLRRED